MPNKQHKTHINLLQPVNRKFLETEAVSPQTHTPNRSTGERFLAFLLVVFFIGAALVASMMIIASKPKAEKAKPERIKIPVEVFSVNRQEMNVALEAMGTVISSQTLELKPFVSGTVEFLSPLLVPGGILNKDELVVRLDQREYQLNYERSKNTYEQAAMDFRIEEGNQAVAKREYQLLQELASQETKDDNIPKGLALREPQLAQAKAARESAHTEMEIAELNLKRTSLYCPFNAVVLDKQVAVGAQVTSQTAIATLAGIDTFWVRIAIPQEQLAFIQLPGVDGPGAEVDIVRFNGHERISSAAPSRKGRIIKLLREVDEKGLMARLLIAIDQPTKELNGAPPMLLGSVVKTRIPTINLPPCYQIPQNALRENDTVYIDNQDGRLNIKKVKVIWQSGESVYISDGLEDGDLVITSNLSAPVAGMELAREN